MAFRETTRTADLDLFRQELCNIINLHHPLVQLSQQIDWQACESRFGGLYAAGVGRPGHPIRLMVGLQLLKHTCNVSDEEVVAAWVENPYWQYFCGEQYYRHDLPIDPSHGRYATTPAHGLRSCATIWRSMRSACRACRAERLENT